MKKVILLLSFVNLLGCASVEPPASKSKMPAALEAEAATITNWGESRLVSPNCENPRLKDPETELVFSTKQCGLLYDSLIANNSLKNETCPMLELKGRACDEQVRITYLARASARYSEADTTIVTAYCNQFPVKCKSARDTELALLTAHNSAIISKIKNGYDRAIARQHGRDHARMQAEREDYESRRQAMGQAFRNISQSISQNQPKRTECSSRRTAFGTVETTCTGN